METRMNVASRALLLLCSSIAILVMASVNGVGVTRAETTGDVAPVATASAVQATGANAGDRPSDSSGLGRRYPATLEYSKAQENDGLPWTSTTQDIWRLKAFTYNLQDNIILKFGPSQVVFGVHGTNVLWAVVIPDSPGEIVKAEAGQGEHVTSLWMRFHPAAVDELFPAATVLGQGDAKVRPLAVQIAAQKVTDSEPLKVPPRTSLILDMETREGHRRLYYADTVSGKLYYDASRTKPFVFHEALDTKTALASFDKLWAGFDKDYPMFVARPGVDWAKLREIYRPRAATAKDNHQLAAILAEMLLHLEDSRIRVQVDGECLPGFNGKQSPNTNPKAVPQLIGSIHRTGHNLNWGRTSDGIGYIEIASLADDNLPEVFDEALGEMADTKGLILDLRANGGGSESLGLDIAGRLVDHTRTYRSYQYRNGPKHTDLSPKSPWPCDPNGPWHYRGPVILLQGPRTMRSAEYFALALAQYPQVTTIGDRTAGLSNESYTLGAGPGIIFTLPRFNNFDAQERQVDVVGVQPQETIKTKPEDFSGERDPVLSAALEKLRHRPIAKGPASAAVLERRPGTFLPKDRPRVVSVFPTPNASNVDLVADIRIRFDRPMNPNLIGILTKSPSQVFRLRTSPQYLAETNEFVMPAIFKPGVTCMFDVGSPIWGPTSSEGAPSRLYSWQFTTRSAVPSRTPDRPRVVSIDPPSGSPTGIRTTIRIRFDRPMDPQPCEVTDRTNRKPPKQDVVASVPFPIEYDAKSRTFTLNALLANKTKARLELRGFLSEDGGQAEPIVLEYDVADKLYLPGQEAAISEAGRSAKLHEVVEAVRRNRRNITSLEETLRWGAAESDFRNWNQAFVMQYGQFGFQGDRQFYADISGTDIQYSRAWRIGSDGQQCWGFIDRRPPVDPKKQRHLSFREYDEVREKAIVICDPFGANRFASTAEAIAVLKLEYLGEETHGGKNCHHIRSWAGSIKWPIARGFTEWYIDTSTLLPLSCNYYNAEVASHCEFLYNHINEPVAQEKFQPPSGTDIERERLELKEGYDRFYWRVHDGSDGAVSAGYGLRGQKGFSGSGLN